MFKYKAAAFILVTAIFMSGKIYAQDTVNSRQIITVNGTVTKIEPEGNIVNVQTDKWNMVFYIPVDSGLFRENHHIASIEIKQGDPVTIQYFTASFGKNNIVTLVDHKSE